MHAPIDGLTITEHTSTVAMLINSDSGVSTCKLQIDRVSFGRMDLGRTNRTRERNCCTSEFDMSMGSDSILNLHDDERDKSSNW